MSVVLDEIDLLVAHPLPWKVDIGDERTEPGVSIHAANRSVVLTSQGAADCLLTKELADYICACANRNIPPPVEF